MPHTFRAAAQAAGLPYRKGKKALKGEHKKLIQDGEQQTVCGSVDLDAHFRKSEPDSNRLDYGIGIRLQSDRKKRERVIWVEVHPGSDVSGVMRKFKWLQEKLASSEFAMLKAMTGGLKIGRDKNVAYVWICTGGAKFRAGTPQHNRLSSKGIIYKSRLELP